MEKENDFKENILLLLQEKEKSTTEIASIMNRDYYFTLRLLEKLERENKIERIKLGNKYTFWKLKNGI